MLFYPLNDACIIMSYKYSPNDVLTLKGAAAQQTTNPGNLRFYQLCEERFDDYERSSQVKRREICREIATSIVKKHGGVFRKYNGSKMDEKTAVNKTMDRMRQIQKPKIVPPQSVGAHDVVFKVGAANHLFPGNAKWRALLDKFIHRYWPELFPETAITGVSSTAPAASHPNGIRKRPQYQVQLAHELIDIIEERGGQFRNASLNVISERDAIVHKVHERFKDLKKYIKAGKYQSATIAIGKKHDDDIKANELFYVLKRTGCTSAKVTVPHGQEDHIQMVKKAKNFRKRQKKQENDCDSDDNGSFASALLTDVESSNDEERDPEQGTRSRKANKRGQDEARRERIMRRAEQAAAAVSENDKSTKQATKWRRRNKRKRKVVLPPAPPDHDVSDYERLRYEKMKRNHERLEELGLLGGVAEV